MNRLFFPQTNQQQHVPRRFLILLSLWTALLGIFCTYSLAKLMPNYLKAQVANSTVTTSVSGNLDSNKMSVGSHTLTVTARLAGGPSSTVTQSFTVQAASTPTPTPTPTVTPVPPDTTPPNISNVQVTPTRNGAKITFTTNELSNTVINYGKTTSYGSTKSNKTLVLNHSISLSSLSRNTLYHYQIKSADKAGNQAVTADATFTTLR